MPLGRFRAEVANRHKGRLRGAARCTDALKAFALSPADERMTDGLSGKPAAFELALCAVTLYVRQKGEDRS